MIAEKHKLFFFPLTTLYFKVSAISVVSSKSSFVKALVMTAENSTKSRSQVWLLTCTQALHIFFDLSCVHVCLC